jgi:hypothetical protein
MSNHGMNSNELTTNHKLSQTKSLQDPAVSNDDAARRAYIFRPVPSTGRDVSAQIAADVADERRRDKWAAHSKKVSLAASLDNRRIFHRAGKNELAAEAVFKQSKTWPHSHECLDPFAADLATRDYWNRPGNDFRAHVTVLPGGFLASVNPTAAILEQNPGGGIRGDVVGFSPQSQTNLTKKLMAIQWDNIAAASENAESGRAIFLGLTFHDKLLNSQWLWNGGVPYIAQDFDPAQVKKCLETFHKAARRFANFRGMIWKMEIEDRKSGDRRGELLPHFHCLVLFNQEQQIDQFKTWAVETWSRICGINRLEPEEAENFKEHGTDTRIVYGKGGRLLNYLVKYLGKTFKHDDMKAGRIWGICAGIDPETGKALDKAVALDFAPMVSFKFSSFAAWREFVTAVRAWAVDKSKRLMELRDDCRAFRVLGHGWQLADTILSGLDFSTVPIIEH